MAWCKTDLSYFFWVNFFPLKVPEFWHVPFNLVVKHFPVVFLAGLHFVSAKNKTDLSDFFG